MFADLKQILSQSTADEVAAEVKLRIHSLCADFIGGLWKVLPSDQIIVTKMKGGMSNLLFLCELPTTKGSASKVPTQLLLRVYFNPETESHLVAESVIFTLLSERQLGPQLFGIFSGGRLEEYIVSRPLTYSELKIDRISMNIAKKLAHIHQLNVPISKQPNYIHEALDRWLKQKSQYDSSRDPLAVTLKNGKVRLIEVSDLVQELDCLKECLAASHSKVVFCHNDLQEGNILLPAADISKDLVFIDFEYASYNYRAFDFANHFCEWAIDYSVKSAPGFAITPSDFPSFDQQFAFVKSYLEAARLPTDKDSVLEMIAEIKPFVPISHFFWAIWSLLQLELSPIDFGFGEYAKQRLSCYYELKTNMTKLLAENGTNGTNGCCANNV